MLARMNRVPVCALLSLLFLAALPLSAQQTATITIQVTDATKAPIPHAQIRLSPNPIPPLGKPETDAQGQFSRSVKSGSYMLLVSAQGFETAKKCVDVPAEGASIPIKLNIGQFGGPVVILANDAIALMAYQNGYASHEPVSFLPADLAALPHTTVTVHNEHTSADETYSGVPLADLLAKLNAPLGKDLHGKALVAYIIATGIDGYSAVLALAEVDPTFHSGQVLVADHLAGKPLAKDGPFKLIVTGDKRPARWVRNLNSIELHTP
jgi:hypothetical protein